MAQDQTRTTVAGGDDAPDAAQNEKLTADENRARYEYGRDRGHAQFCQEVRRLEDLYMGGGSQWEADDRQKVEEDGRLALEFNEIMPAVNAAVGYQIENRMDIGFRPRGGMATQELANVLGKVAMQVADNTELHWKETEVFSDGLIQRAGYFDIRVEFDDSMRGEARIEVVDPMDVIPDPDAKTYDPNGWGDVIRLRWLSLDEIEALYGKEARVKAEQGTQSLNEADHGDDDKTEPRNKFGDSNTGSRQYDVQRRDRHMARVRVIDRQKWVYKMAQVIVSPDTGDVRVIEDMGPEMQAKLLAAGGILTKRMAKRVRWIVTTYDAVLHEDWSPYPFFTLVPYFPYFRRGRRRSMVDGAAGPQQALNKAVSKYLDIMNTQSNSGWIVEENSLVDMEPEDLEERGSQNGLVVVFRKGSTPPKKIDPAPIPAGLDRMIDRLGVVLKENTVPDAARGVQDHGEESGVAVQSRQYAARKQLAIPLDNLARTRKMLARRLVWIIQNYYDDERIYRITKPNPITGQPEDEVLRVNVLDPALGVIHNDLTIGEYDVAISEQPMQAAFEDGQWDQLIKMKEIGVPVPDSAIIRASAYSEKNDLLQQMAEQGQQKDPLVEAEVALKQAQTEKTQTEKVAKAVEAQFSAIQTAQTIAQVPATAPLADALLKSAGYIDMDAAPIVPNAPAGLPTLDMGSNTNPLTPLNPANPGVGIGQGIETPAADSVAP